MQAFQGGLVSASTATGSHVVPSGPIADAWAAQGWTQGPLGAAAGAQYCGLIGGGCLQNFSGGTMYSTAGTGTHAVPRGQIATYWAARGWEAGPLGYPVGAQRCGLVGGGCVQAFQGGSVYRSDSTAAQVVTAGPIADAWAAQGSENGSLGYPTGGQFCGLVGGGCLQSFSGGTMYSTVAAGAHAVPRGQIATYWAGQRWERGPLGYPVGAQRCGLVGGGCVQAFQGGSVYSSAGTPAQVLPAGPIADAWAAQGSENGPLGYPIGAQHCGLVDGGCLQGFQGGTVYSTTATGAHAVSGPIAGYWAGQRWEAGPLGYPTSDAHPVTGGTAQHFQGGVLTYDTVSGRVSRS